MNKERKFKVQVTHEITINADADIKSLLAQALRGIADGQSYGWNPEMTIRRPSQTIKQLRETLKEITPHL